jgi:hypothetical protein
MSYDPGISGISGASDVFLNNPVTDDALSYNTSTGKWENVPVDKTRVGLSNVDNTSDANKPVSTATQTALNLKAPLASPTFTGTVSGVSAAMVGLGNVNNTSDANKPVSTAVQTALSGKANESTTWTVVFYTDINETRPAGATRVEWVDTTSVGEPNNRIAGDKWTRA